MAPTIEAFKKAFAGKVSPDLASHRDQQVTAALKKYSQAVGDAKLDPTEAKASKDRLFGLVQRFDKLKQSKLPPKERLDELDDILKMANSGVSELAQSMAPPPPASLPPQLSSGPPNQLQLLVEKKQLEEKLAKMSYIGADADRRRLEEINIQLDILGPIPPKPPAKPQVDNRPSAGELVARDKQAALEKRSHALGFADGLTGEATNVGEMSKWEDMTESSLTFAQMNYAKGYGEGAVQRKNDLQEAHRIYKATRQIPQTKQPYAWIEIKEGRVMNRAERMDAMLKDQGRSHPTMDMIGNMEVNEVYLTRKEFQAEIMKRVHEEMEACGRSNKCKNAVKDKYGGKGYEDKLRKQAQQIKAVADRIEDVKNAGPVKLAGKAVGRGVGYAIGGDEGAEIGDQIGGMVGGVGDIKARQTAEVGNQRGAGYQAPPKPVPGISSPKTPPTGQGTGNVPKPPPTGQGTGNSPPSKMPPAGQGAGNSPPAKVPPTGQKVGNPPPSKGAPAGQGSGNTQKMADLSKATTDEVVKEVQSRERAIRNDPLTPVVADVLEVGGGKPVSSKPGKRIIVEPVEIAREVEREKGRNPALKKLLEENPDWAEHARRLVEAVERREALRKENNARKRNERGERIRNRLRGGT